MRAQLILRGSKGDKLTIEEMDNNLKYLDNKYSVMTIGRISYTDINMLFQLPQERPIPGSVYVGEIVLANYISGKIASLFINETDIFFTGYTPSSAISFTCRKRGSDIVITVMLTAVDKVLTSGTIEIQGLVDGL
jgi:hypothetical protein